MSIPGSATDSEDNIRQNTYQLKLIIQKVALISNDTMKRYAKVKTDRAWFSHRPQNKAGLFLQP